MGSSIKPKGPLDALATIAFLAETLPALQAKSGEAAALVECAVRQCVQAIAVEATAADEQPDLAGWLDYAVDDVARISAAGAGLVLLAVQILREQGLVGKTDTMSDPRS